MTKKEAKDMQQNMNKNDYQIHIDATFNLDLVDNKTAEVVKETIQSQIELMLANIQHHLPISEDWNKMIVEKLRNNPSAIAKDLFPKTNWKSFVELKDN